MRQGELWVRIPQLDELETRLKHERDGQRHLRLHLLILIRSGQIQERQEAAAHLAVHRNVVEF
jgi:hypothetical protein